MLPWCGSTNAEATRLAKAGAGHGLVLCTTDQRTGRGRFERVWEAPAGTMVATTVLVTPRRPVPEWGWLSLLVGIAVVEGIRQTTGLDASLKWPNDVLIDERKCCGILSEAFQTSSGWSVALGFGINVSIDEEDLPVPTATSLRLCGADVSAVDVVSAVLVELDRLYRRWDAGESLIDEYRALCGTLGKTVRVHAADGDIDGVATGVTLSGCLIVTTDGVAREFAAGDVVHLR